jgi:hypothetical protein
MVAMQLAIDHTPEHALCMRRACIVLLQERYNLSCQTSPGGDMWSLEDTLVVAIMATFLAWMLWGIGVGLVAPTRL